jgi:glutathione S-transferase
MLGFVADRLKLFVVPASHPCAAVERALAIKGLAYDRVDLLPIVHLLHQQLVFGRPTVPGLRFSDGGRVVGSRAVLRVLEALEPHPPLLPADPARRAKAEAAEVWADEVLQPLVRRVVWAALQRRPDVLASYAEGSDLPVPVSLAMRGAGVVTRVERLLHHAGDAAVRADLAALPAHLDRIDRGIATGVLGGEEPTVADLQIAAALRLLTTLDDMAASIDERPAGTLARRLFPSYAGSTPAGTLSADWLRAPV